MLRTLCHDSGNILDRAGKWLWRDCPPCGGTGVQRQYGAAYANARYRWRRKP